MADISVHVEQDAVKHDLLAMCSLGKSHSILSIFLGIIGGRLLIGAIVREKDAVNVVAPERREQR